MYIFGYKHKNLARILESDCEKHNDFGAKYPWPKVQKVLALFGAAFIRTRSILWTALVTVHKAEPACKNLIKSRRWFSSGIKRLFTERTEILNDKYKGRSHR